MPTCWSWSATSPSARAAAIAAGLPVLAATEGPEQRRRRPRVLRRPGRRDHDQGARGWRRPRHAQGATAPTRSTTHTANAPRRHNSASAIRRCSPRHTAATARGTSRCRSWRRRPGTQTHALALGDRDCSIQRRYQKLVEIAPAQQLSDTLRRDLHQAAARLCARVELHGLATVEFLVAEREVRLPRGEPAHPGGTHRHRGGHRGRLGRCSAGHRRWRFLLPAAVAGRNRFGRKSKSSASRPRDGASRFRPGSTWRPSPPTGPSLPAAGTLTVFSPPSGPGVRVDTYGRPGLTPSPRYDSLLAKVDHPRTRRLGFPGGGAQGAYRAGRVHASRASRTNIAFLRELLSDSQIQSGAVTTSFLDEKLPELAAAATGSHQHEARVAAVELYPGEEVLRAQLAGTVVEFAAEGAEFGAGAQSGRARGDEDAARARRARCAADRPESGDTRPGRRNRRPVGGLHPHRLGYRDGESRSAAIDLDRPRADLDEVRQRHLLTLDEGREAAVPSGTSKVAAPRGRTSPTWSMPAASSNTARWPSPRNAAGAPRRT